MRYWSVDFVRKDHFALEVEAETPEEAMAIARERICDSETPYEDFGGYSDGFEMTGCR